MVFEEEEDATAAPEWAGGLLEPGAAGPVGGHLAGVPVGVLLLLRVGVERRAAGLRQHACARGHLHPPVHGGMAPFFILTLAAINIDDEAAR